MKGKKEAPHGGNRDRGKRNGEISVVTGNYITSGDFFEGLARWNRESPVFEMRCDNR
ncbi:MAG: hypothetical protein K6E42_08890 [Synergistes sp.]|nr:hypothetical protein [Synergistes sp.]